MKNIRVFLSKKFQFLEVKFSAYLNRRVFVMVGKAEFHRPCLYYMTLTPTVKQSDRVEEMIV